MSRNYFARIILLTVLLAPALTVSAVMRPAEAALLLDFVQMNNAPGECALTIPLVTTVRIRLRAR